MYQVEVQGKLDPDWMHEFQGITTEFDGETTTLKAIVADQSALRGLLCYLWDFNLTILSVVRVHSEGNSSGVGELQERN
jgi:hypothetical protein